MRRVTAAVAAGVLFSTGALVASAAGGTAPSTYVPPCTAKTDTCRQQRIEALEKHYQQHEHPTAAPTSNPSLTVTPTLQPNPTPSWTVTPSPSPSVTPSPTAAALYAEDFTKPAALGQVGAVYGQSMRGYDGNLDTSHNGTYTPDKVLSVHDGMLDYYLHSEGGKFLVAAPVLNDYNGFRYGKFSVRMRADVAVGYKVAFLLWPSDRAGCNGGCWSDGEIDFPEADLRTGATATGFSHCAGDPAKNCLSAGSSVKITDWHTYTTDWATGQIRFLVDGVEIGKTSQGVPQQDMRWTLQAETDLSGTKPAATSAGHVCVDWVRVER